MNAFHLIEIPKIVHDDIEYFQIYSTQYEALYKKDKSSSQTTYKVIQVEKVDPDLTSGKRLIGNAKTMSHPIFELNEWSFSNFENAANMFWQLMCYRKLKSLIQ